MNSQESSHSVEMKISPVEITRAISKGHLKIMELTEYCNAFEKMLKELNGKAEMLSSEKVKSEKELMEYFSRNKINLNNYNSLLQAKNQLYEYKRQLKIDYMALEMAIKSKKLRYTKIISSYQNEWEKNLALYKNNPLVATLLQIQSENEALEEEIKRLQTLKSSTESDIVNFKKTVEEEFQRKIVEFAEEMCNYRTFSELFTKKREAIALQQQEEELKIQNDPFSKIISKFSTKKRLRSEFRNEMVENFYSPIDFSIFDDLKLPIENLEKSNEEDLLMLFLDYPQNESIISYEKEREFYGPASNNNSLSEISNNDRNQNQQEKSQQQASEKSLRIDGNESHYFKNNKPDLHQPEQNQHLSPNTETNINEKRMELTGTLHSHSEKELKSKGFSESVKEKRYKTINQDNCVNVAFENQVRHNQKITESGFSECEENLDQNYVRPCSASSGEISGVPSSDNLNGTVNSPDPPPFTGASFLNTNNNKEKEKSAFGSFGSFFTMGNDQESATPSIFKLF